MQDEYYFNVIFTKNPNINLIEDIYKTEIKKVSTIEEITSFNLSIENRTLIIDFTVRLINGESLSIQEII